MLPGRNLARAAETGAVTRALRARPRASAGMTEAHVSARPDGKRDSAPGTNRVLSLHILPKPSSLLRAPSRVDRQSGRIRIHFTANGAALGRPPWPFSVLAYLGRLLTAEQQQQLPWVPLGQSICADRLACSVGASALAATTPRPAASLLFGWSPAGGLPLIHSPISGRGPLRPPLFLRQFAWEQGAVSLYSGVDFIGRVRLLRPGATSPPTVVFSSFFRWGVRGRSPSARPSRFRVSPPFQPCSHAKAPRACDRSGAMAVGAIAGHRYGFDTQSLSQRPNGCCH